jgi:hypothetical protein
MLDKWKLLATYSIPAKDVEAPWLMAVASFDDATHLKLEAIGKWEPAGSVLPPCDPDGLPGFKAADDRLVVRSCRFGALIGKVGGSSASHHTPDTSAATPAIGEPFGIGTVCILKLPDKAIGPLFVSFNAVDRPIKVTSLSVTIHGTRLTD